GSSGCCGIAVLRVRPRNARRARGNSASGPFWRTRLRSRPGIDRKPEKPMTRDPAHAEACARLERLVANVERVIFGKRRQIHLAVIGLLAEGHVLLEDVPGVGKTTLARALAKSLALDFRRV